MPPAPVAGVPDSTPADALNVTPPGSVPVSERTGTGKPVAVTLRAPAVPAVNVVALELVIAGGWLTVIVKGCTAFGLMPFCAVKETAYVPPDPEAGVPDRIPVALLKLTPRGSVPLSLTAGAGMPIAVIENAPD